MDIWLNILYTFYYIIGRDINEGEGGEGRGTGNEEGNANYKLDN